MKAMDLIKSYKNLSVDIKLLTQQINFYNELLQDNSKLDLYEVNHRSKSIFSHVEYEYMTCSQVEKEAFKGENIKKVKIEYIKKEKKILENMLAIKVDEKNFIDMLLKILSNQEKYIIMARMIEKYSWEDTLTNYNSKYRDKQLSLSRLKEIRQRSLKKIEDRIIENETSLIHKWSTL